MTFYGHLSHIGVAKGQYVSRGHVIGTHSASHPARFSALTTDEMRDEWSGSRMKLEDILGRAVTVGSVPGGYFSTAVAKAAADTGLRTLFTSEPTTKASACEACELIGRFTLRRGHPPEMARRFAASAPWARCGAWVGWNTKALVKPMLGASYALIAIGYTLIFGVLNLLYFAQGEVFMVGAFVGLFLVVVAQLAWGT